MSLHSSPSCNLHIISGFNFWQLFKGQLLMTDSSSFSPKVTISHFWLTPTLYYRIRCSYFPSTLWSYYSWFLLFLKSVVILILPFCWWSGFSLWWLYYNVQRLGLCLSYLKPVLLGPKNLCLLLVLKNYVIMSLMSLSHSLLFPPSIICSLDFIILWFLTFTLTYFLTLDPLILAFWVIFISFLFHSWLVCYLTCLLNFVISMTIFLKYFYFQIYFFFFLECHVPFFYFQFVLLSLIILNILILSLYSDGFNIQSG